VPVFTVPRDSQAALAASAVMAAMASHLCAAQG
jgi:hypothetical protein